MTAHAKNLAEAKLKLPLSRLMHELGLGDRAKTSARCPFHEETSPSFSVYTHKSGEERWKCFSKCGGGDAISFLAKARRLSNADACREFVRMAGVSRGSTRHAPAVHGRPSRSLFIWERCLRDFGEAHAQALAEQRGYSIEFVRWLHAAGLLGVFAGKHPAFPVRADGGAVVGCHYRLLNEGSWRYHPKGTRALPLVAGDLAPGRRVVLFESQWDLFALLDRMGIHRGQFSDVVGIATRGASNGADALEQIPPGSMVYGFPQNDPAGRAWLRQFASRPRGSVVSVETPAIHKDLNDWTRAGATSLDIEAAMAAAQPIEPTPTATPGSSPNATHEIPDPPLDDDGEPTSPAFPIESLPGPMAAMVQAVARAERVPVALPALVALGVASASLGAGIEVRSSSTRTTRGNLFLVGSAESGCGKSETFRHIGAPIYDIERHLLERCRRETNPAVQAEQLVVEATISRLQKQAAKAHQAEERDAVCAELSEVLARKEELVREASMPCVITQDVTTERLAGLLHENREVGFSASSDARKVIENLLGRYNPGKTTDESFYLSAYSGGPNACGPSVTLADHPPSANSGDLLVGSARPHRADAR